MKKNGEGRKRENNKREEYAMATLKEIAQYCGVSVTTVSNIVNNSPKKMKDETRKKVMDAIETLGYHPNYFAQGLRRQRTQTIGIIAEDLAQFTTPNIVEGIMKYCEEKHYRVILQNLRLYARWKDKWYDDEELIHSVLDPALKELASIKVDGLIYVAGHERQIHLFEKKMDIPMVLAYCHSDESKPSVEIDDEDGGYQMTKYILSQGYTKIGVISGRADNIHAKRRLLGYQRALFEAGVLYNPAWVLDANWEAEKAYELTKTLVKAGVDAIFCMSDWMAGGVYNCIHDMGLEVGKDIAVTGFDNERLAHWYIPKLTSCRLPLEETGTAAAKLLFEQLEEVNDVSEGNNADIDSSQKICAQQRLVKHIKVPCEIKIRDSVPKR